MINGFEQIGEHLFKCSHCNAEIKSGIINISGHWANCAGKPTIENVYKIGKTNLPTSDKMDLLKNILNITQ